MSSHSANFTPTQLGSGMKVSHEATGKTITTNDFGIIKQKPGLQKTQSLQVNTVSGFGGDQIF